MVTGSINLTAFKSKVTKVKTASGEVDAIIIPLASNGLEVHKNGSVYMNIVAWENKKPQEYSTHMIKQSFSKDKQAKMSDEEKRFQPIFGNLLIKDGNQHQDVVNTDDTIEEPTGDLPF